MTIETATALWYVAPGEMDARPAALGAGDLLLRTLYSGVSRGTERLVLRGQVPPSEYQRMRGPAQEGDFPFPVKYGYCCVAEVIQGPADWLGQRVFTLHPHQTYFRADVARLARLPDGLPPARAVLAANMETALNALWDAGAGPADRIAVVGGGSVGVLVAALAAGLPGARVSLLDPDPARQALAATFGVAGGPVEGADIVFHASGAPSGLQAALDCAGLEAAVVDLSWYGVTPVTVALGGAFHAKRLRLIGSQVGQVAPSHRARWSYGRRLAAALDLLCDARFDALLSDPIPFAEASKCLPAALSEGASALMPLIVYPDWGAA